MAIPSRLTPTEKSPVPPGRPMRWPAAVAMVLASVAWSGVPASAGDAAVPPEAQPEWQALAVPWPHVGDAGSYSRSIVRMSGPEGASALVVEGPALRESFVVEPSGDQYDG